MVQGHMSSLQEENVAEVIGTSSSAYAFLVNFHFCRYVVGLYLAAGYLASLGNMSNSILSS